MEAQTRRWQLLLERSLLSVQICTPDGTTVAVNRVWEALFQTPREEILGWNILTDPQLASDRRAVMARAFAGEPVVLPPMHYTLRAGGDEPAMERWIGALMYPIHDDAGRLIEVVCIHDDATEQRRAEHRSLELNASLERQVVERTAELARFATISDMTHDFLGIADMSQRVLYVNPAGRAMLGWGPQATDQSRTVQEVYTAWAYKIILEETIPKALQDDVWTGDLAVQHVDGHEIPVSMVGIIVKDKDGRPEFMSAIMRDTSARARIEQELHRALRHERELSRLKSNFVSMVSHEFRTPLAIILSSSEILEHFLDALSPEQRREQLGAIKTSVDRMTALMEQVLTFSRMESGELECHPQPIDLVGFCARLHDELRSAMADGCRIEFAAENSLAGAVADEKLLRPILSNLLTNAVKYSRGDAPVRFSARREGHAAIFTVIDRGLGIPAADLENLFTAFRRARNVADLPGTGLGLVIVRKCLDAHGGEIHFESVENEGTTARVTLPLFAALPSRAQPG